MDLDQDYGRSAGRKQQRLHEKDGRVRVDRHGDRIRASPRLPHPELRWKAAAPFSKNPFSQRYKTVG